MNPENRKSFWPGRWWWVLLLIILMGAGLLRYSGYDFGLPYVDHPDEPQFVTAAQMILDNGSAKPMRLHAYPPGLITLNLFLLRWFHNPAEYHMTVLGTTRLISVTVSLGIVIVVALLAYRIAPPSSGLIAAVLWAVSPIVTRHSRFATADNFVTFFALLALFCALSAAFYARQRWSILGTASLILAVLFKYQALFIAPLVLLAPLWPLRENRSQYRVHLEYFGWNMLLFGLFLGWLFLIFPILDANDIPNWVAPTDRMVLPGPGLIARSISETFGALGNNTVRLLGLLGLPLLLLPARASRISRPGLLSILAAIICWVVGVSFFGSQDFRQYVALAALLVLLSAVGWWLWSTVLTTLWEFVAKRSGGSHPATRGITAPGVLMVAVIVIGGSAPDLWASIEDARRHMLPDRRNDLMIWMDTSVPPGGYIAPTENHKTFNGPWGGYTGIHEYPVIEVAAPTDRSIATWRDMGVMYAIPNYDMVQEMVQAGSPELGEMLLLKSYPPDDRYRGPSMAVFRLFPMQYETSGRLGSLNLVGYDLNAAQVEPGEALEFTLYWQADAPLDGNYAVYNHLTRLNSREIIAQVDGAPLFDERRGTMSWNDPAEILISRQFSIPVEPDVLPGQYRLITGFYRQDTGERLQTTQGDDFLVIAEIEITG